MTEVIVAQKSPYAVGVEAGKEYWWCRCGHSANQLLRDGSHKGTGFHPVPYGAQETKRIFFCGCKRTGGQPLCDRTDSTL
ncbi:MAG: CDGSH iron-sulfur domain-containing protein [Alphaproteobacteria bacterium]